MRNLLICSILTVFFVGCNSGGSTEKTNDNIHKVKVLEVIESGGYTYLKVVEDKEEKWLAAATIPAKVGEIYYYEGGMTMENFTSESLNRTFESIIFLDKISKDKPVSGESEHTEMGEQDMMAQHHTSRLSTAKEDISMEPVEGGITVAELYQNKSKYEGKKVTVKGKVTKFNEQIMNTNWIHIQDGTDYEGKYDITANSDAVVEVGQVIILEGRVVLDKDLGHGYAYEIILENAKVK